MTDLKRKPLITVLTPTYNRKKFLPKLFDSLCSQNSDNWVWLIVDDGSTDGTADLLQKWVNEYPDKVYYIIKSNGGKHTAINVGLKEVNTPLVFIVDSDDTLLQTAISTIEEYHAIYGMKKEEEQLCGFSFLRVFSNGEINAGEYADDNIISTYAEQRINVGDTGDKAEVFYTDILKKFPFPVFKQETFLPEDSVWMAMSGTYRLVFANRKIYICDYHEGGLTKTGRYMKIHSPLGMMYRSAVYLTSTQLNNKKVKLKMIILYQIYERFAMEKYHLKSLDFRNEGIPLIHRTALWYLLYIPTYIMYCKWNIQYKIEGK